MHKEDTREGRATPALRRAAHWLMASITAVMLAACGGGGNDSSTPPPATTAKTLGATGGTMALTTTSGVQIGITVPAGALSGDIAFTLQEQRPVGNEAARIEITPPGVAFAVPVTVTMTLPAGRTMSARFKAALQIGNSQVVVPGTVDVAARTVTLQLDYFGMNGNASPSRWNGPTRQALSARALEAPAPTPGNTLTLTELATLEQQRATMESALFDLESLNRFEDAAKLQLSLAALAQSAQVPEWQSDAENYLHQAEVTVCSALTLSVDAAAAAPVATFGAYQRVASRIVYWQGAVQALGTARCTGTGWLDTLNTKLGEALTFVKGEVSPAPTPAGYTPVAAEIRATKDVASEASLLHLPAVATSTRDLYVNPALQPLRVAAFDTSLTAADQSEYLKLLGVFGPTESLQDDAQYASTTFTVTTRNSAGTVGATRAMGRSGTVGAPVRTATLSATADGTLEIAGNIAVLHCPSPGSERLQVLFENHEIAAHDSITGELLSGSRTLPTLQIGAMLRAAGIDPAKATRHILQIKRASSTCVPSYGISNDLLATVTLSFAPARSIFYSRWPGANQPLLAEWGTGIESVRADGTGGVTTLTTNAPVEVCVPDGARPSCGMFADKEDSQPTLSPDGSQLLFKRLGKYGQLSGIALASADGSSVALRTTSEADHAPSWSPDSKRIAFARSVTGSDTLIVMNVDGSNAQQLASMARIDGIAWSPDGTRIAMSGDAGGDTPGVYVVAADGSSAAARLVAMSASAISPSAWSPDGNRIAFGYSWIVNADGTGLVQIPRQVAKSPAAWSPDGSELAFIDCPNFACAIYVMKADGTNLRQLTDGATLQGLGIDLSWR